MLVYWQSLSDGRIVAAQQGHMLATAFHPELTGDDRFHRYFLATGSMNIRPFEWRDLAAPAQLSQSRLIPG